MHDREPNISQATGRVGSVEKVEVESCVTLARLAGIDAVYSLYTFFLCTLYHW